ncbi:flagellin [Asticcacaulis tiandongensis]|uniref:flagellin n=1 Tax=Asticcacaulis tiandongensis TaxID=2565365 RepID=UPI00112E4A45|nr:flagellin [Asticcacaulis tiandongensis]
MTASVHTNKSAMIALQNLNASTTRLESTQNKISTGLNISGARDNASVYSIAQGQRADLSSLSAVTTSLNRATSIADVAMAAGESISDLLNEMRENVVAAMDPSIDEQSRIAYNDQFQALLRQIAQMSESAKFDGANILNGVLPAGIDFIADADAGQTINLGSQNFKVYATSSAAGAASAASVATTASPATTSIPHIRLFSDDSLYVAGSKSASVSAATEILGRLDTTIKNVNSALGALGAQAKQIEGHLTFVSKLTDSLTAGIGNLVDADLAKESARLQALQVQQQLGTQALSIANQAPQVILSLFRGG